VAGVKYSSISSSSRLVSKSEEIRDEAVVLESLALAAFKPPLSKKLVIIKMMVKIKIARPLNSRRRKFFMG